MSALPVPSDEPGTVSITVELPPDQAAALARICDKFCWSDADQYLYPHVAKDIRHEQSYQMMHALVRLEKALVQAGVRAWPWVETGSAE